MMQQTKKILLIGGLTLMLLGVALVLYTAYAGGGAVISLNSPVSFPVDI